MSTQKFSGSNQSSKSQKISQVAIPQEIIDAVTEGDYETLENLIQTTKLDNYAMNNILIKAIKSTGTYKDKTIVSLLLSKGASSNTEDSEGRTVLMLASERGYTEIIHDLLENGAQINKCDRLGRNALFYAIESKAENPDIVRSLINQRIDVNCEAKDRTTPLMRAIEKNYLKIAEDLLKNDAILQCTNENGDTLLHTAIRNKSLDAANLLIKYGADPNKKNRNNQTVYDLCQGDPLFAFIETLHKAQESQGNKYIKGVLSSHMRKSVRTDLAKKTTGDTGFNTIVEQINRDAKNTAFFDEGSIEQRIAKKGMNNFSRPTSETFNSKNSLDSYSRSDSISSEGLNNESQKQEGSEQQGSLSIGGKSNGNIEEEGQSSQSNSTSDNFQQVGRPKRKDQNQYPYQPGQKGFGYQGNKFGNNQGQNSDRGNKTYTPNQFSNKYQNNGSNNMSEGQGLYNQPQLEVMKNFNSNWTKSPVDNFKYPYNVQGNSMPFTDYHDQQQLHPQFAQTNSNFNVYSKNFVNPNPQASHTKALPTQFFNNNGSIPNGVPHMISTTQQQQIVFNNQPLQNQHMPNFIQSPNNQTNLNQGYNPHQYPGNNKLKDQNKPCHHHIDLRSQHDSANLVAEVKNETYLSKINQENMRSQSLKARDEELTKEFQKNEEESSSLLHKQQQLEDRLKEFKAEIEQKEKMIEALEKERLGQEQNKPSKSVATESILKLSKTLSQFGSKDRDAHLIDWIPKLDPFKDKLHREILEFEQSMDKLNKDNQPIIEEVLDNLRAIVAKLLPTAEICIYGSYATGLNLNTSSIDVAVKLNEQGQKYFIYDLENAINEKDWLEKNTKIVGSIIKVECSKKYLNKKIDILVMEHKQNCLVCIDLVKDYLDCYPMLLRPLYLVLKYFLTKRNLNKYPPGGLNSYGLFLMLVAFFQATGSEHSTNLGELLTAFFYYYGVEYDYIHQRFVLPGTPSKSKDPYGKNFIKLTPNQQLGSDYNGAMIIVQDPLNFRNNVTRNVNILKVKNLFAASFIVASQQLCICDFHQCYMDLKEIMMNQKKSNCETCSSFLECIFSTRVP